MRETQLSDAAQGFRRRLGVLTRKYERLLIEYRKLLQQMDDNHLMDRLELRPYEDILSHIVGKFTFRIIQVNILSRSKVSVPLLISKDFTISYIVLVYSYVMTLIRRQSVNNNLIFRWKPNKMLTTRSFSPNRKKWYVISRWKYRTSKSSLTSPASNMYFSYVRILSYINLIILAIVVIYVVNLMFSYLHRIQHAGRRVPRVWVRLMPERGDRWRQWGLRQTLQRRSIRAVEGLDEWRRRSAPRCSRA